ncbi:LOW QUALITY PROTEIN: EF-hand calcium-binding domain-containing protein 11 [Podargus strigoides]
MCLTSESQTNQQVFEACDEYNKGYLTREDFKVAVVMFGYKTSKVEVDLLMSSVRPQNSDNMQTLSVNGFYWFFVHEFKKCEAYPSDWKAVHAEEGFLTFENFKKDFNSVSTKLSERIIVEALGVNQDSDGGISFKEFEFAMKGQDEVLCPKNIF